MSVYIYMYVYMHVCVYYSFSSVNYRNNTTAVVMHTQTRYVSNC